ncbi:MAG: hypothetical protein RJA09_1003 [Pseudomonadota bacterium]
MAYVANAPARNAGFLWRAEKAGRTSWLYGTMHLNHIDFAKPGPQVMLGLRSSDMLAVEINLHEPQSLTGVVLNPNIRLSTAQLQRLRQAYTQDCLKTDPAATHPVGAATPLLVTQAQRQGLFFGYSPDARLVQVAQRVGKPVIQLETLAQQVTALAPTDQTGFDIALDTTLSGVESGALQQELVQLNRAWQQGDWTAIVQLERETAAKQPDFAKRLNDERNVLMADKIDALHQGGQRVFVAVGVLHMAGPAALPLLLQNKGYRVTAVPLLP